MNSKEMYQPLVGMVIGLDALMGVGKSVTGRSLEHFLRIKGYKVKYYPEFVNFLLLALYLQNKKEHAFEFQAIMVRERLRIHQEASDFARSGGIAIVDRTIYGDRAFEALAFKKDFITEQQHAVYLSLIDDFKAKFDLDVILYLDCNYDTCLRRIGRRGNEEEVKAYQRSDFIELDQEYLKQLSPIRDRLVCLDFSSDLELVYRDGLYYLPESEIQTILSYLMKHFANRRRRLRQSLELSKEVILLPTENVFSRISERL